MILDIETTGLNPMKDRITCISVGQDENIFSYAGIDERRILEDFWDGFDGSELISFNGDGFDIPFIIKRSLINDVKIKKIEKTIDLRKIVNGFFYSYNKYEKGTLDEWAQILLGKTKETNGLEVIEAFNNGDFDTIKRHCEEDVEITKALYERCKSCDLL